jgi:lysophospholipase L1-like esterase
MVAVAGTAIRWLALGDSYTIGEAVDAGSRWPQVLADALRAQGIAVAPVQFIAGTGWSTDELGAALEGSTLAPPYDLVSLLIGVNNQYRGRDLDEYRVQFTDLLLRAVALAGDRAGRVLVLSIPDWGVTPFAASGDRDRARIAREIDAFNATACEICAAHRVAWVDITPLSRDPGAQATQLAGDGLHPSAAQYALWAAHALPVALRLLGS